MIYNAVVFASGGGTNFENLVRTESVSNVKVIHLIVDHPDAFAIERAKRLDIPYTVIEKEKNDSKAAYEKKIFQKLSTLDFKYILLAGYMKILSKDFIDKFNQRIINIHPSLLPAFKGKDGIADAFRYGVKVSGVTVHFVDDGIDTGKIIDQLHVNVSEDDTIETFEANIHEAEYKIYPRALKKLTEGVFNEKGIN